MSVGRWGRGLVTASAICLLLPVAAAAPAAAASPPRCQWLASAIQLAKSIAGAEGSRADAIRNVLSRHGITTDSPLPKRCRQAEPDNDEAGETDEAADTGEMAPITVAGEQILREGEPWWLLGYNSFTWSGDCGTPDERMSAEQVDDWFASMRHDGHGAARLFFFAGWDLHRLDAAIASAKRHHIYLIISLDNGNADCGEEEKTVAWFANDEKVAAYAEHMTMLLERYKGATAIAWFEYFNEPSYHDGALREFYDEMGALADTIDPARLFSSGTVAPYWLNGEQNFRDVHASPGVDIASLHEYDATEIESHHGVAVRANSAGTPVIVGEFGINAAADGHDCDTDFDTRAARVRDKAQVYTDTDRGYVGALIWAWQPGNQGTACETGNVDADEATQQVLRTIRQKQDEQ